MENASKALLMVAGLLISILVVSLLIFVANQMADYRKSESSLKNVTQLKDFNEQFTQYARDDLKGVDLISLVNKIIDYNKKSAGVGEINYDKKIKITIDNLNQFETDTTTSFLFNHKSKYEISSTNTGGFLNVINRMRNLEETYGLKTLDVLSSGLSNLKNAPKVSTDPLNPSKEEVLETMLGKSIINKQITMDDGSKTTLNTLIKNKPDDLIKTIETYREFSEFKTSTFSCVGEPEYDGGQISSMKFNYVGNT